MTIDFHAHIFSAVNGRNRFGRTLSSEYGKIITANDNAQEESIFLPPFFEKTAFTAPALIELMDREGIDKALLLQNPTIGIVNEEIATAVAACPDRFYGTIQVDPMAPGSGDILEKYAETYKRRNKKAFFKLEMSYDCGWTGLYPDIKLNRKPFKDLVSIAAHRNLGVIIDTGPVYGPACQVEEIDELAATFRETVFIIEHLGFLTKDVMHDQSSLERRNELLNIGTKENVFFGCAAFSFLLDDEWPYADSLRLLREAVELLGSTKIMWGSDIPGTFQKYTYRQMIDIVTKHADFLKPSEIDRIMGLNALDVMER